MPRPGQSWCCCILVFLSFSFSFLFHFLVLIIAHDMYLVLLSYLSFFRQFKHELICRFGCWHYLHSFISVLGRPRVWHPNLDCRWTWLELWNIWRPWSTLCHESWNNAPYPTSPVASWGILRLPSKWLWFGIRRLVVGRVESRRPSWCPGWA